ncbi:gag-pol fusion [Labeo rohita]|uniref:Gypsy retrotransposon integrase-like protein 1 n=1 Tax=Labeo rohita TaxID=84645 RepID=A0A498LF55_LABRO|nr:gag-pol fusion [Labeo rohita]
MDEAEFKVLAEFKRFGKLPNGLTRHEKFIFLRRAKSFAIENDILYYVRKDGTLAKVLSTKECAQEIFEQFHSRPIGAHCGIQKTLDAISKRFYWPGMSVNIKHWVTHCAQCQKNPCSLKNLNEYTPIEVAQPWDIVGMDLVGKLTPTKEGYQYICVMVDYFTKWCEAFPLKTKSAEEVTTCIIKHFYKFGAPKRLLTDQGTEFVNKLPNGLTRREKFIFLRRAKSFAIENDILYYVRKDGTLAKVVSTKECAQEIFEQFHSRPIGAHCGIQKTLDAISKRFYWPGMSVNIKHWVTHCAQCQKNPCSLKNPSEYTPIEVINAYLTCIARRYPGKAGVIDSFQMTNLWKGKATEMKKMDPQAYDLLVGSVNEGDHWTLLIIYPQEGRIIYMNSCGESSNKIAHCIKAVRLNVKFAKAGTTGTA